MKDEGWTIIKGEISKVQTMELQNKQIRMCFVEWKALSDNKITRESESIIEKHLQFPML